MLMKPSITAALIVLAAITGAAPFIHLHEKKTAAREE
jgi:hypothetical protein